MRRGRFITLEGGEGAGKSLQISLLEEEFRRREFSVLVTREPGGTEVGRRLREILLSSREHPPEPVTELLLYLADRCQHLRERIEPALNLGTDVLCDRYHDATRVYQGFARNLGLAKVDQLARLLEIRTPDLTLYLDVDVEIGLHRALGRNRREGTERLGRFEAETLDFHRKVREGYLQLVGIEPERIRLIDASGDVESVRARILEVLAETGLFE